MNRKKEPTHSRELKQSYRGYVREHLDLIESKIAFGHPHELIRQELNHAGFESSLLTFRDALTRARRWREGKVSSPQSVGFLDSSRKAADGASANPSPGSSPNTSYNPPALSDDAGRYFKAPSLFRPKGQPHEKT